MPTQNRRETELIRLFLSAYQNDGWRNEEMRALDETRDGAVDGFVKRKTDGCRLAIEHTLIEPFVDDKKEFARFERGFITIDQDKSLIVPGRIILIYLNTAPLIGDPDCERTAAIFHTWLKQNVEGFPMGESFHECPIGTEQSISLCAKVYTDAIGEGGLSLGRYYREGTLGIVVEKALRKKLPKLLNTEAERRILLLERERGMLDERAILKEIDERIEDFSQICEVDEIWFAQTMFYERDDCVEFNRYQSTKLAENMTFLKGRLIHKIESGEAKIIERI